MNEDRIEEADTIVCLQTVDLPHRPPGSKKERCSRCGWSVWIALDGQHFLKRRPDVRIECLDCIAVSGRSEDQMIITENTQLSIFGATGVWLSRDQLRATALEILREKRARSRHKAPL